MRISDWILDVCSSDLAGVREVIEANSADFGADVFIASDGPRVSPDRPTITLGNRGARNFDLVVDMREGGHHSGNWGGLLSNPGIIPANAIATIVSPKGRVLVPGLLPTDRKTTRLNSSH